MANPIFPKTESSWNQIISMLEIIKNTREVHNFVINILFTNFGRLFFLQISSLFVKTTKMEKHSLSASEDGGQLAAAQFSLSQII